MAYGCKICIATKGLKGNEIANLPQTEEEFHEHLEKVHGIKVVKDSEEKEKPRD